MPFYDKKRRSEGREEPRPQWGEGRARDEDEPPRPSRGDEPLESRRDEPREVRREAPRETRREEPRETRREAPRERPREEPREGRGEGGRFGERPESRSEGYRERRSEPSSEPRGSARESRPEERGERGFTERREGRFGERSEGRGESRGESRSEGRREGVPVRRPVDSSFTERRAEPRAEPREERSDERREERRDEPRGEFRGERRGGFREERGPPRDDRRGGGGERRGGFRDDRGPRRDDRRGGGGGRGGGRGFGRREEPFREPTGEPRQEVRDDLPEERHEGPKEFVVPGDLLEAEGRLRPGPNTYKEGPRVYAACLGIKQVRNGEVSVMALSGRYHARPGDMIIGTVHEVGPSIWLIDIRAASPVVLHVNDVPWRVEFGETNKFMASGDAVLLKIAGIDEIKKVQLTMKDRACRKLSGGLIFEVAPSKVARIIGRGGSMTELLKAATNTRMYVGQNGVIWIDGEPQDVALAMAAIRKIEDEAHYAGLTDKVKAFLEEHRKSGMSQWKKAALEKEATPWA